MKIIGITQARVGSSRLPGKVLLKVNEKSLLRIHLERAKQSKLVNEWITATTNEPGSEEIVAICDQLGIESYRGDLDDVLARFYYAARDKKPDYVVRLTSDCTLIDPDLINETIRYCLDHGGRYYCNQIHEGFPDGMDVEVFTFEALEEAFHKATETADREHVTPYIRRNVTPQPTGDLVTAVPEYAKLRLTVDVQRDFDLIKRLIETLGDDRDWKTYAEYIVRNDEIREINETVFRNEGYMKSKLDGITLRNITNFKASNEYRNTIHRLIPGGAHTYSKGDDQFPVLSPAAIVSGKHAHLWDIDGNEFLDCSMGLTSISLGHAYNEVIDRVKSELDNGVNFQRPSYLEKELAEKFLSLVPQHEMIKFAKNGSIVTTAAVKLARAKTGRKLVAFPFDHPFYSYDDWFIGTTPANKGVPEEIANLSLTFKSCDIESLRQLFAKYPGQIACIITEPEKATCLEGCPCGGDTGGFLKTAIDLCHEEGALFILDEMITGFKTAFPGSIKKFNIEPDMATWGKGIANGFSFCALTGKEDVMKLGGINRPGEEKVFLISTTHGGETHSLAAALATIDVFQRKNVIADLHSKGRKLIEMCKNIIDTKELGHAVGILPADWMPVFTFLDGSGQPSAGMRTLMMQEMIRRGVLFQGVFVPCFSHTEDDLFYFAKAFGESLDIYKKALEEGYEAFLTGEPVKPVFRKIL